MINLVKIAQAYLPTSVPKMAIFAVLPVLVHILSIVLLVTSNINLFSLLHIISCQHSIPEILFLRYYFSYRKLTIVLESKLLVGTSILKFSM